MSVFICKESLKKTPKNAINPLGGNYDGKAH